MMDLHKHLVRDDRFVLRGRWTRPKDRLTIISLSINKEGTFVSHCVGCIGGLMELS